VLKLKDCAVSVSVSLKASLGGEDSILSAAGSMVTFKQKLINEL
jgi:hypothetical protein